MISVPTKHLKAALLAAAKEDVRYYLKGVFVEAAPAETRCVATDGNMVVVLRHARTTDRAASVIVPRDVVEAAIKAKRDLTEFEQLDDEYWLANGTHRFKPVEGTFPPYRRIMPVKVTGAGCRGFDPELFARFAKVATALGKHPLSVTTHLNGDGPAAITIEGCPDFAGALAPTRFTKDMGTGLGVQGWAAQ